MTEQLSKEGMTGYPSIDKPWEQYYSKETLDAVCPSISMYEYLVEQAKNAKHRYCLNYFGKRISYVSLFENIKKTAASLTAIGVKAGDVVSICLLTMPENYYLMYAVNLLGGICNYVAVNNTVQEIRKRIVSTKSRYIFTVDLVEKEVVEAVGEDDVKVVSIPVSYSAPLIPKMVMRYKTRNIGTGKTIAWKTFLENGEGGDIPKVTVNGDTPAIIEYTSGTTGDSKGALHPNRTANQIAYNYAHMGEMMQFGDGERFLNILPPFYAYGIFVGVHMPLCVGVEVYLSPNPDPKAVANDFVKYKPQHFTGGPNHINSIVEHTKVQKMDLCFLKTVAFGGDSVSYQWKESVTMFFKKHRANIYLIEGYGMTEVAGTFCTSSQKSTIMIPFPKNNIKVIDVDTQKELKINQEGEIYISGPTLMDFYWGDEYLTKEVIFEDEKGIRWLKTGDLGFVTPDGELVISGRLKRIYWTCLEDGVYRVYPMKIEQVINSHKNVIQAAVVGVKDKEKGYLSYAAAIVDNKDIKEETVQEIKQLCREKLDTSSQIREVFVFDEFPTTNAGKVDYKEIQIRIEQQIG